MKVIRSRTTGKITLICPNSLCFGVFTEAGEQVDLARVVMDYATFAWIGDVFIAPAHRGRGLSKWLEC